MWRGWASLGKVGLVVAGSLLGLVLAEGLLRATRGPAEGWEFLLGLAGTNGDGALRVMTEGGSTALNPGTHVISGAEFRSTVTVDARRSRRALAPQDPASPRVLVLGDSFTLGIQVEDHEVFTARLERDLRAGPAPEAEVLNYGMNGVGTAFSTQLLRREAAAGGAAGGADGAVLVFFLGNDLSDNAHSDASSASSSTSHGYDREAGRPGPLQEVATRSLFGSLAWATWMGLSGSRGVEHDRLADDILSLLDPARRAEVADATRRPLHAFERSCRHLRLTCEVVLAPPVWALDEGRRRATLQYLGVEPDSLDTYELAAADVARWVPRSLPVRDLLPALVGAQVAHPDTGLYLPLDGHWTAAGHEVVSDALIEAWAAPGGRGISELFGPSGRGPAGGE